MHSDDSSWLNSVSTVFDYDAVMAKQPEKLKEYINRAIMTIKIEDGIDDLTAIRLVKQVIEQGKISNNGNSYCYLTLFGDISVEARQYRKSPCFIVYKNKLCY